MPELTTTPGTINNLRAEVVKDGIVTLTWAHPPAAEGRRVARIYVIRFRVGDQPAPEWDMTRFLPGHHVKFQDESLAPGIYRYSVGGLSESGSSRAMTVEVEIAPTE